MNISENKRKIIRFILNVLLVIFFCVFLKVLLDAYVFKVAYVNNLGKTMILSKIKNESNDNNSNNNNNNNNIDNDKLFESKFKFILDEDDKDLKKIDPETEVFGLYCNKIFLYGYEFNEPKNMLMKKNYLNKIKYLIELYELLDSNTPIELIKTYDLIFPNFSKKDSKYLLNEEDEKEEEDQEESNNQTNNNIINLFIFPYQLSYDERYTFLINSTYENNILIEFEIIFNSIEITPIGKYDTFKISNKKKICGDVNNQNNSNNNVYYNDKVNVIYDSFNLKKLMESFNNETEDSIINISIIDKISNFYSKKHLNLIDEGSSIQIQIFSELLQNNFKCD